MHPTRFTAALAAAASLLLLTACGGGGGAGPAIKPMVRESPGKAFPSPRISALRRSAAGADELGPKPSV